MSLPKDKQGHSNKLPPLDHDDYSAGRRPLFVLMGVLMLHLIDRQIMAILAEPIKQDLHFSDTEIGLLTGIGFSFVYSLLGIPIARYADRHDRGILIAVATAIWSIFTAISGLATGFISMLLARVGVAVGEAGGIPPLHSLVADLYPEHKRARAFSIVQLGGPLGVLVAFLGGGLLISYFNWRTVFFGAGILGIIFALILVFCLPEPRRHKKCVTHMANSSVSDIMKLMTNPVYRHLVMGTALAGFGLYAMIIWFPSFLQRSYALPIAQVGIYLGLMFGVLGAVAVIGTGILADYYYKKKSNAHIFIPAVMMFIAVPFFLSGLFCESSPMGIVFFVLPIMMVSAWHAPIFAAIQKITPTENRSLAAALNMFVLNMIGLGFGPLTVGILSDYFEPAYGSDSLKIGLCVVPISLSWAAIHWFIAAKMLRQSESLQNPSHPEIT